MATESSSSMLAAATAIETARKVATLKGLDSKACAKAIQAALSASANAALCKRRLAKTLARAEKLTKEKKKKNSAGQESWENVVHETRRLLKRTHKLQDLLAKQLSVYHDETNASGKKFGGWASIWDYIKGIADGKKFTARAKEIDREVADIMKPYEDRLLAESKVEGTGPARLLAAADRANANPFTRRLGNPNFRWLLSQRSADEYTIDKKEPKIHIVQGSPMNVPSSKNGVTWAQLQQVRDDPNPSYNPVYGSIPRGHKHVKARIGPLPTKHARVVSAPLQTVEAVNYNPTAKASLTLKPTIEDKNQIIYASTHQDVKLTPNGPDRPLAGGKTKVVVKNFVQHDPTVDNKHLQTGSKGTITPRYQ